MPVIAVTVGSKASNSSGVSDVIVEVSASYSSRVSDVIVGLVTS